LFKEICTSVIFFVRVLEKLLKNNIFYAADITTNSLKHGGLDAGHGVVGVAGDDGLDKNPRAVGGSLNDNTLEFVITFVLPLGLDADTITDAECRVLVMG
jgi:hypothetical protein